MEKRALLLSLAILGCTLPLAAKADTLQNVVKYTVHTNPEVAIAVKQRDADDYALRDARAALLPTVETNYSIGTETSTNNNTAFARRNLTARNWNIEVRENIFDGLGIVHEIARNKAVASSAAYNIQGVANDVALRAVEAYLDVMRTNILVGIGRKNVAAHRRTYNLLAARKEAGLAREGDVSQALGRLALARANLVAALSDYRAAKATYVAVVGKLPRNLRRVIVRLPRYFPHNGQQAVVAALKQQPFMHAATSDVDARLDQLNASRSLFFPRVDGVFRWEKGFDIAGVAGPNDGFFAGVEVSYNIFRGGGDKAQVYQNGELVQEAVKIRNNTARETVEQSKLSWAAYISDKQAIPKLRQHKIYSAKVVVAYIDQYKLGKRSLFDLLDSENEKFQAANAYVNGVYALLRSKYRVLHAMDKLLTYLHIGLPPAAVPMHKSYIVDVSTNHGANVRFNTMTDRVHYYPSQRAEVFHFDLHPLQHFDGDWAGYYGVMDEPQNHIDMAMTDHHFKRGVHGKMPVPMEPMHKTVDVDQHGKQAKHQNVSDNSETRANARSFHGKLSEHNK